MTHLALLQKLSIGILQRILRYLWTQYYRGVRHKISSAFTTSMRLKGLTVSSPALARQKCLLPNRRGFLPD